MCFLIWHWRDEVVFQWTFFFFSKMFTDLTIITFVRLQHRNDSVKCTAKNFELLMKQSQFKTDSSI